MVASGLDAKRHQEPHLWASASPGIHPGLPGIANRIAVWLHGTGATVDVTYRYSVACEAPLTFCIGISDDLGRLDLDQLSLKYCRRVEQQVLGEI